MPSSPREMIENMKAKMPTDTGKTFDEWVAVAKTSGLDKHKALTVWLKTEQGLKHNQAQWIAWGVTDPSRVNQYERPDDLVDALYSGKKAALRPIYEALLSAAKAADADSRVEVCKTYSSVANRAQFCIINPRTQKLVDLELVLPDDTEETERLRAYTNTNPRFTRRIRIGSVDAIDAEVHDALARAARHVRG